MLSSDSPPLPEDFLVELLSDDEEEEEEVFLLDFLLSTEEEEDEAALLLVLLLLSLRSSWGLEDGFQVGFMMPVEGDLVGLPTAL